MKVEKTYGLYEVVISYGKRKLVYNSNQWRVVYFYENKVVDNKTLNVHRYWKALHKYHSSKHIPEIIAPQILTIEESR